MNMAKREAGFRITDGKGFHIVFENGWGLSVQFGGGNYCSHYNDHIGEERTAGRRDHRSKDAEIALLLPGGGLAEIPPELDRPDSEYRDSVAGYCNPAKVLCFMQYAAAQPNMD
jgi:hypothetical protein